MPDYPPRVAAPPVADGQPPDDERAPADGQAPPDGQAPVDGQTTAWTRAEADAYFAPFVRVSPPVDAYEVIKTAVMCLVLPFRFLFLIVAGALVWLLARLAMVGVPASKLAAFVNTPISPVRNTLVRMMFPLMRAIAFVCFGIVRVRRERLPGAPKEPKEGGQRAFVVVSNHLGYLDILMLLCVHRASFVSKGALERFPVIGTVAAALQCLFVRDGESLTTSLVQRLRDTIVCHKKGPCPGCPGCLNKLVIFPEGTTTNGTAMIALRTGVFNAGVPVQPVCVRFPHRHFNISWETISFKEHMFRTMTQVYNDVVITQLPVYEPSAEEKMDARLYAANVQRLMADVLKQKVYPLNRKHKFLYHSFLLRKIDGKELREKAEEVFAQDAQLQYLAEVSAEDNT